MTRDFGIGRLLCSTKGSSTYTTANMKYKGKNGTVLAVIDDRLLISTYHRPPASTPAVAIYYIPLGPELMRATYKKIQTSAKGWTIRKVGRAGNLCEPNDHQFLRFSSSNVVEEEKLTFSMDHFFICSHPRFVSPSQTHLNPYLSVVVCQWVSCTCLCEYGICGVCPEHM